MEWVLKIAKSMFSVVKMVLNWLKKLILTESNPIQALPKLFDQY